MRAFPRSLATAAAAALCLLPTLAAARPGGGGGGGGGTVIGAADPAQGRWANPKGTLAVETRPCAGGLCGAIVWASATAQADARDAGVANLVGTQLLQNYRRTSGTSWSGRVYVPDMGRSFSSRIRQADANTLVISGCLVGGFLCKSQTWRRVP